MYTVVFRTSFERTFKKLDRSVQQQILDELSVLAQNPFSHPHIRPIVGVRQKAYRLRVGRWRVLYLLLTRNHTLEVIDLFIRKGKNDYQAYV